MTTLAATWDNLPDAYWTATIGVFGLALGSLLTQWMQFRIAASNQRAARRAELRTAYADFGGKSFELFELQWRSSAADKVPGRYSEVMGQLREAKAKLHLLETDSKRRTKVDKLFTTVSHGNVDMPSGLPNETLQDKVAMASIRDRLLREKLSGYLNDVGEQLNKES